MFAKIFNSEKYGQLLAKRDVDEDDNPELRVYAQPEGLGICSCALKFDDESWEKADAAFDKMDLHKAEQLAGTIFKALDR